LTTNKLLPDAFIEYIRPQLPPELSLEGFISACQQPLRRSIRINTLKTDATEFESRADKHGWMLTPVPWCPEGYWINQPDTQEYPLGNSIEHLCGQIYIQEASSMLPVDALFAGETLAERPVVLDCAAAPGSKTTQIAARLAGRGLVVANEFSSSRIKGLYANLQRCGIANGALTHFDARVFGHALYECCDLVLIDAPCSGEGTVRKDPDALRGWDDTIPAGLAQIQRDLVISAFQALKPGGAMVYSTCTLNQQENQQVCRHLLESFGDAIDIEPLTGLFDGAGDCATPEGYLHVWPQVYDSEGFFVAKFRKRKTVAAPEPIDYKLGRFPFQPSSAKAKAQLERWLSQQFDCSLPEEQFTLYQRENEFWLFPAAIVPLIGRLKFDRIGLKLAESHKKGFRPTHEFAIAFGGQFRKNCLELSLEQAREFFRGRDLRPEQPSGQGEVLLTFNDRPLGWGRWVGGRIKNNLPRELVRDTNLF